MVSKIDMRNTDVGPNGFNTCPFVCNLNIKCMSGSSKITDKIQYVCECDVNLQNTQTQINSMN